MHSHTSPTAYQHFKKFITDLHKVEESVIVAFFDQFEIHQVKKGEVLVREGEVCRHIYFILEGSLRCFRLDKDGKEINMHFYFENELASEFNSLRWETPSERYLVAMSATKLLKSARPDYLPLFSLHIDLLQAAMRFFQETFFAEEEQTAMLRQLSAAERYHKVAKDFPHLLQRVSLTQLASWLGTSRESLSRFRNKMAT